MSAPKLGEVIAEHEWSEKKDTLLTKNGKNITKAVEKASAVFDDALKKFGLDGMMKDFVDGLSYKIMIGLPAWMTGAFIDMKELQKIKNQYQENIDKNKAQEGEIKQDILNSMVEKYNNNKHAQILLKEARNQGIKNIDQLSYIIATAQHETRGFKHMKEVEPKKKEKDYRKEDENGKTYYGRGYVQLTHKKNYEEMQKKIDKDPRFSGINIVENPDIIVENNELSAFITVMGMRLGLFTGKSLDDYTTNDGFDAEGARKIVNGVDKKDTIAQIYEEQKQVMVA